jgi:hypothetical protein
MSKQRDDDGQARDAIQIRDCICVPCCAGGRVISGNGRFMMMMSVADGEVGGS